MLNNKAKDSLIATIAGIPDEIDVFISRQNWQLITELHEAIERPHTTLYKIDGLFGRTWGRFLESIIFRAQHNPTHRRGVSMRHKLATSEIIDELNANKFFCLLYSVDKPKKAQKYTKIGVSGITSNKEHILVAFGAGQEPQMQTATAG
jgi:hypothetical protein